MQPVAATRSANSMTLGVMPGISAMMITAGPVPRLSTWRVAPSWVNVLCVNPDRSWSATRLLPPPTLLGHEQVTAK